MTKDARITAQLVLEALGGKENIQTMTHCATRLRVVVKSDQKVNKEKIEDIEGVNGYFYQSGQHQVILGTGFVNKVHAELLKDGIEEGNFKEAANQKLSKPQQFVKALADIFIPIIPVLIATGLLMGVRGLLVNGFGMEFSNELIVLSQVLTDTAFVFIPVLVTWSAMKKFGGTPVIGMVLGLMLVAPQLPDKWAVAFGEAQPLVLSIFGFDVAVTGMQSSILPAIFIGWLAATLEKKFRQWVPEVLDLILTPFLTLFTSLILGLVIFGPLIMFAESILTNLIMFFFELPFGIGGFVYGGLIQFLAVTGMHHTIVPIEVSMLTQTGVNIINPIGTAAIAGQAGAALAVVLAQKDKKKRATMFSSVIPAFFGITEPLMFAVNLPKGSPFLFGCLGGAVGGGLASILGIAATGTGATMLPGMLLYIGDGLLLYILVILVALFTGFITTKLAFKEKNVSTQTSTVL
ncbi:PTS transporter subunit EIIC [Alkalibacterium sp. f15]|uniref:PTS transporter subunit EIIC n=1 Tax=Alkalibacterium sp. f15 TaxID=3414029 RepID=UPI003BF884D0